MATSRPDTGQPLANARHERFSIGIVSGLSGTQAWLAVAPGTSHPAAAVTANRLLNDAKVAARIAALRAPARAIVQEQAEEAAGSAMWIAQKAVEVVTRTMQTRPRDAVPALALLAKMYPATFAPDGGTVDARSLTLVLPEGTTLADLKRLRGELG